KEEIKNREKAVDVERFDGKIEFKNVTLRYAGDDEKALKNISFIAEKGKTIGLLGATGSGKTSVTQLMTRFYEPVSGQVLIDDRNVKEYSLKSLRSNIGFVHQESFLFSSSIKANISYGRPDATMDEIIEA